VLLTAISSSRRNGFIVAKEIEGKKFLLLQRRRMVKEKKKKSSSKKRCHQLPYGCREKEGVPSVTIGKQTFFLTKPVQGTTSVLDTHAGERTHSREILE